MEKVLKINVGTFAKKVNLIIINNIEIKKKLSSLQQLTCHVTGCQLRVKIFQNVGMEPLVTRKLKYANVTRDF